MQLSFALDRNVMLIGETSTCRNLTNLTYSTPSIGLHAHRMRPSGFRERKEPGTLGDLMLRPGQELRYCVTSPWITSVPR